LPEPTVDSADERAAQRNDPSPEHSAAAAELAAQIDDENLRKVVAKAAALSLANADSGRTFW